MMEFLVSLSWGLWILAVMWLVLYPNWASALAFLVLIFTGFALVYWGA